MHQARIQQKQGIEGYGGKLSYLCIVLELQRCTLDLSGWRCDDVDKRKVGGQEVNIVAVCRTGVLQYT